MRLGHQLASMPDFEAERQLSPASRHWLATTYALVKAGGDVTDTIAMKSAMDDLDDELPLDQGNMGRNVASILARALAVAELSAPAASQGAFIPAGSSFDAFVAVGKVLSAATTDLLIVDPYMDEKALIEYGVSAAVGVTIRLLADQKVHKASLRPAVARWSAQYKADRPLEARLASPGLLHDRLIFVDRQAVWVLTQSLNAFAVRSPASIVLAAPDVASLKIAAYANLWAQAAVLP